MRDYRAIFEGVESTLIRVGSSNRVGCRSLSVSEIRTNLERYKELEGRRFSDEEVFMTLVKVVFYSGFRAATVTDRLDVIHQHFPDYRTVATYGKSEVDRIVSDPAMIRNRGKIQACVKNARTFKSIVSKHGSFQSYVDSYSPKASHENLLRLKAELQHRFSYLGEITTYHALMEIGMPTLKPDRVICRIFHRLGLIQGTDHTLEAIEQGSEFARATGYPIRYIDIVFVFYGQSQSREVGLEKGICLKDNPRCDLCGVSAYCTDQAPGPAVLSPAPPGKREAHSRPVRKAQDTFVTVEPVKPRESETRGHCKGFAWEYESGRERLHIENVEGTKHSFSLAEIQRVLERLSEQFGEGFFPLANNVAKLGNGTEVPGLGTTILEQQPGNTTHGQGSSYLGVVLEECGYLEWNGRKRGIKWRLIRGGLNQESVRARLLVAAARGDSVRAFG